MLEMVGTSILLSLCILLSLVSCNIAENDQIIKRHIQRGLFQCNEDVSLCPRKPMYGAQLIQLHPKWFVFQSNRLEGALVYDDDDEDDVRRGVFLYPDNISCIRGTWRKHLLVEGRYCEVEGVDENEDEELIIKTKDTSDVPLKYSPATFFSFGSDPVTEDPYESRTVTVKTSLIAGAGQGLFARRRLRRGELVSFYGGLVLTCQELQQFGSLIKSDDNRESIYQNSLQMPDIVLADDNSVSNTTINNNIKKRVSNMCVTVPPEMSGLESYRATLGHKANHHREKKNAEYGVFTSHPVLGTIMAVYATEDIDEGEEVFCNYGYEPVISEVAVVETVVRVAMCRNYLFDFKFFILEYLSI